jgi:type IV pilus assembly protein PilA
MAPTERPERGFTLIELLIVMIIVGILAAIAVPVFLSQRKKAVDSSMKTDLRTVAVAMDTYFADNNSYPAAITTSGTTATIATGLTVKLSEGNTVSATVPARTGATDTYCLIMSRTSGSSAATQNWVYINDQGGIQPLGTTTCS